MLLEAGGTNGDGAKDLTSKEVSYMNGKRQRRRPEASGTKTEANSTDRTEAETKGKERLGVSFSTAEARFRVVDLAKAITMYVVRGVLSLPRGVS